MSNTPHPHFRNRFSLVYPGRPYRRDRRVRPDQTRCTTADRCGQFAVAVALDAARRLRRRHVAKLDPDGGHTEVKAAAADGPPYAELLRIVRDRYLRLAPRQRAALLLRFPDEDDAGGTVVRNDGDDPTPPTASCALVGRPGMRAHVQAMAT